ncbi:MAG: hypothetical protein JW894_05820 [Bacteroidales bacterium]|nr:hypothetical protein [Bacteroidales bacterium]
MLVNNSHSEQSSTLIDVDVEISSDRAETVKEPVDEGVYSPLFMLPPFVVQSTVPRLYGSSFWS